MVLSSASVGSHVQYVVGGKDAWVPFGFRFRHELGSSSPFIAHLKKAVAHMPPPLSVLPPEVAGPFFTGF